MLAVNVGQCWFSYLFSRFFTRVQSISWVFIRFHPFEDAFPHVSPARALATLPTAPSLMESTNYVEHMEPLKDLSETFTRPSNVPLEP